jgi:hypothetical protein
MSATVNEVQFKEARILEFAADGCRFFFSPHFSLRPSPCMPIRNPAAKHKIAMLLLDE